jgi:hypothetical protein
MTLIRVFMVELLYPAVMGRVPALKCMLPVYLANGSCRVVPTSCLPTLGSGMTQ